MAPSVGSNDRGVVLSSPAGMIAVPWDDVPAMLADLSRHMQARGSNEHLAHHARLSAPGLAAAERTGKL